MFILKKDCIFATDFNTIYDMERYKEDVSKVLKGEMKANDLVNKIALNTTTYDMASWIATKLIDEIMYGEKIAITQTEFRKLLSIFKIKGIKGFKQNGEMILETRGSKENRPDKLF